MAAGALKRAAPPAHGAFDELQRGKNSEELDLRIWSVASGTTPSSRMTSWPLAGAPPCQDSHPAHFVMDCFDYLDSASSSNQP